MAEVDAKAQALVAKACGWVASNPDTWAKLRRICYRLMLEGHVIQRDNVLHQPSSVSLSWVPV